MQVSALLVLKASYLCMNLKKMAHSRTSGLLSERKKAASEADVTCVVIGRATVTGSDDQCEQSTFGTYTEQEIRVPQGGDTRKRCKQAKREAKSILRVQIPDACSVYVTSSLPCRYLNC